MPNKDYWAEPTAENRAKLSEWLNFEGVRRAYIEDIPDWLKPGFAPESWHLDWERMSRPELVKIRFRVFADYGPKSPRSQTSRPSTANTTAGVADLGPAAHFLLETHHRECAALMREFILDVHDG